MKRKQAGFTLVELAIVLVIIGLLLAGILKGQELINSAKVKNLGADFRAISTAYYGYLDKFRAVAGDDQAANTHVTGGTVATTPTNTPSTLGNGHIEGAWNSTTTTDESYLFWQHVRLAGLMPGNTTTTTAAGYVPTNAQSGRLGISNTLPYTLATGEAAFGGAFYVCSDGISGKLAKQLDATMDDGVGNAGSMRVVSGTASVASPVDDTTYFVCIAY